MRPVVVEETPESPLAPPCVFRCSVHPVGVGQSKPADADVVSASADTISSNLSLSAAAAGVDTARVVGQPSDLDVVVPLTVMAANAVPEPFVNVNRVAVGVVATIQVPR